MMPIASKDAKQHELSFIADGYNHFGSSLGALYKVKYGLTIWSDSCTPRYLPNGQLMSM